jgi:drug/metabolite transporter (DMT)-like permease
VALVGSTLSYAAGGVYARRFLRNLRPLVMAMFELGFGLLIVAPAALVVEGPIALPSQPEALFAVLWLGLVGSGLAFVTYFRLLATWGATRTSLVAYLMPVNGLLLGAAVLGEAIDARLVVGLALIISGIAVVQLRSGRKGREQDPAPAQIVARTTSASAATASSIRSATSRP